MAGSDGYAPTKERIIPDREQQQVQDTLRLFDELTVYRNVFAAQWEEAAQLIDPDSRNTFFYGSYNFPGTKKTQQQIDSTGALALQQFCAICDSLVTPKTSQWHGLASDEYVKKDRLSRLWLEKVTDILFRHRYRPSANFAAQNFSNWRSLGAYGNSVMYIDELDTRWFPHTPGLRYKSVPLGECFFAENHQGHVTTLVRWFRRTAAQAVEAWGIDRLPPVMRSALELNKQTPFQFLHCVKPRSLEDYDPGRLDARGKPFESYYVSIEGKCLMGPELGYRRFPYAVSRYMQMPNEQYGRGPAQLVLPSLKTLNAEKTIFLKAGHRAGDPVLLLTDDGIQGLSMRPGAANKGGMSPDGKSLVGTIPVGNIQITKEMMDEERGIVETMFMTSLFKVLTEHPDMTATQVIELMNERGMLVSPTLGRQHNEYVGALVEREIDVLSQMRDARRQPILPPMPPRLREALGQYGIPDIEDTSPLADAARMNEAAGLNRLMNTLNEYAKATGDPSVYDPIDMEVAVPDLARIYRVRETWIADGQKIAAKRKGRAQAQQQDQQIKAMPAQAAMVKAQAVANKNAPQGGMPPGGGQPAPATPQFFGAPQ